MNSAASLDNVSVEGLLAQVTDEFLARLDAGEQPDIEEFATRYPSIAEVLHQVLPALRVLRGPASGTGEADGSAGGCLGDFRILREVGRGGMGIVYEAEQVSLRRRVALKVLPFAATMDPRHLQRFQNEAQAAACLHHTNIVPVYFVGVERGVHFYAMQFIDGQPLSELIHLLRQAEKTIPPSGEERTTAYQVSPDERVTAAPTVHAAGASTPLTSEGKRGRDYYRKVAELGAQAAEALDHAHQLGIVHRDIKPGNLLLDGRGNLWVTDFGLAHVRHGESNLTVTGQLVGTPRYMSPEQALSKRVPIDHRTDIYSLGATLYELLSLRPAFASEDRQELLRQIAFEDPARLRRLNKAIPAELETIVHKAMEKRPQDRYATAQELADDLRRWLLDQPIRARRPRLMARLGRWGRRHKPLMAGVAAALMVGLSVLAGSIGWVARDQAVRRAESQKVVLAALEDTDSWQRQRRLPEALSAARRANGLLAGADVEDALRQRVRARLADLELLDKLENVRLEKMTEIKDMSFDLEGTDALYGQTFRDAGLDVEALPVEEAGERIRRSTVAVELAAVLDHRAVTRLSIRADDPCGKDFFRVARAADPDAWRTRVREALERRDRLASRELAASEEVFRLSPATLVVLGLAFMGDKEARGQGEAFLREAQRRHPNDFWLNENLYYFFRAMQPPQLEEAFHFAAVAVALRPESSGAHLNLGAALRDKGRLDEAIAEYREAIRLKKDSAEAHVNLGLALRDKGELDEAIAECREAIRLKKELPEAHNNLGLALHGKGLVDEAIAEYREAIRLKKDSAEAHSNLGVALLDKGRLDEAIAEYREAIRLKKDSTIAHNNLGNALRDKGRLDEGIAEYREAIRLKKDYATAHSNLGAALYVKGQLDKAIVEYRESIRLKKELPEAHNNLGLALRDKGELDEAIAECREAIRLKKDYAEAHLNLGNALHVKGQVDEAIAECREAIRLKKDLDKAHDSLGVALLDKGRVDEGIAEFREAIRLKKDYAEAHYNLGLALMGKGQVDEAIAECREAIRLKKELPEAHNNLGLALHGKGLVDEAIAEYREAIRLKKDSAEAHSNLGVALLDKGRLDEGIAEYREAIRLKKDYATAHSNLGAALYVKGQLDKAIVEYRESIRLKKELPEAHNNLGLALRDKGELDEAIAECREAIRLKKDYAEAHLNLGNALHVKGQVDEAIAECREAIRLKKDLDKAHDSLGVALLDKGRVDEGIAEFREAIRLKKDSAIAHYNLGNALHVKGRQDGAIAEYREAIRLKKDDADAHYNLGVALMGKGRVDEAIAAYREAIRLKKDFAKAHYNLGLALMGKGQVDEAIAEYREAIRLKKDLPEAHSNLGLALRDKGELDEAITAYREAIRLKKDDAIPHYNLGLALMGKDALFLGERAHNNLGLLLAGKGHLDEAIAEFREAIRLKEDYAEAHCSLAVALRQKGQLRQSVEALRCGHELGSRNPHWPYPSAQWLRQAEQLARLDDRLSAVLQGKDQPEDAAEYLGFAQICQLYRKDYAAAARFYGEAFAAEPKLADDLNTHHRYNAACAAALAGCGQGKDADKIDMKERARLRKQAQDWLQTDLKACQKSLEKEPEKTRPAVAGTMQHWLKDTDFAVVRDPEAIGKLPEAERSAWRKLWEEVEALRQQAAAPKTAAPVRPKD